MVYRFLMLLLYYENSLRSWPQNTKYKTSGYGWPPFNQKKFCHRIHTEHQTLTRVKIFCFIVKLVYCMLSLFKVFCGSLAEIFHSFDRFKLFLACRRKLKLIVWDYNMAFRMFLWLGYRLLCQFMDYCITYVASLCSLFVDISLREMCPY